MLHKFEKIIISRITRKDLCGSWGKTGAKIDVNQFKKTPTNGLK